MAANECVPYYDDGDEITGHCTAAVTGKTCVLISADMQSGPGLSAVADGGNLKVAPATAAGRIFGVAAYDAPSGGKVTVLRGPGIILPITAGASIAAFQEVEVGTGGKVVPLASGKAIGVCLTAATNNNDAMISLYHGGS